MPEGAQHLTQVLRQIRSGASSTNFSSFLIKTETFRILCATARINFRLVIVSIGRTLRTTTRLAVTSDGSRIRV